MSSIKRVSFPWATVFSTVSTGDGMFIALSGFMQAADLAKVRCTWEAANETIANMITKPGYQTANVENAPDAPAGLGTDILSGNGMKYGTVMTDISAVTQGKALVRLGIWVKLPSGSTMACLRVVGVFDVQSP